LPELGAAKTVRVLWRAEVGAAEDFVFSPALVGDAVYAAARDGTRPPARGSRRVSAPTPRAWR
jgi:hypothetical protein